MIYVSYNILKRALQNFSYTHILVLYSLESFRSVFTSMKSLLSEPTITGNCTRLIRFGIFSGRYTDAAVGRVIGASRCRKLTTSVKACTSIDNCGLLDTIALPFTNAFIYLDLR